MTRVTRRACSLLLAMLVPWLLGGPAASAQELEVLHAFSGPDGCTPAGGLVVDPETGVLYGTTKFCGASGNGTVFSLTPPSGHGKWKLRTLYAFKGGDDGAHPVGLTFLGGASPHLVGVTETGPGAPTCVNGCGTLFIMRKTQSGKSWRRPQSFPLFAGATARGLSVEVDFQPISAPVVDPVNNFALGTALTRSLSGAGSIYQVDLGSGNVSLIYDPDVDDAAVKTDLGAMHNGAALAISNGGRLIGTALQGGAQGAGTLFELFGGAGAISSGQVLASFPQNKPGPIGPFVAPTFGSDFFGNQNIFGTTIEGGDDAACPNSPGCGTVWRLDADGNLSVLHSFAFFTNSGDGQQPNSPLVIDPNIAGLLYGTTLFGGTASVSGTPCVGAGGSCGTIFQVDAAGNYQVLWQFDGGNEPANPEGTLAFDNGALFGTSDDGGGGGQCFTHAPGCGTVWKLTPP